jgi:hypothetical protein
MASVSPAACVFPWDNVTDPNNPQWAFRPYQAGPSSHLIGIDLTNGNSGSSQRVLAWDQCPLVRSEGFWSPGDLYPYHDVFLKDGKFLFDPNVSASNLGVQPPSDISLEPGERLLLDVNNDDILVIGRYPIKAALSGGFSNQGLLIYDKKAAVWSKLNLAGNGASIRGFGPWIVTAHAERKRAVSALGGVEHDPRTEPDSPGSVFRRNPLNPTARKQDQATIDSLFQQVQQVPFYLPGELVLYNVRSQQKYTIKTDQGDSEVLLVDGDTVYYRVNNTLYRATIGKTAIQNPVQMVRDDEVQFAHWAFLGPPVAQ